MAGYGNMAVAAMGVAAKVTMITGMISTGMGQVVQPLIGYCVGDNMWKRLKKTMAFSLVFSLLLGLVMTGICYIFLEEIVGAFLSGGESLSYGMTFSRILLSTSLLFGIFYVLANALQAMGAATVALIVNLSRQGIIFIPALFIMQKAMGITGLVWAQPVADVLSLILVAAIYVVVFSKMKRKMGKGREKE